MAKSGSKDSNWDTTFTDNIGLYSTTAAHLASKKSKSAKNAKLGLLRHSRSSKVIEVGEIESPYAASY